MAGDSKKLQPIIIKRIKKGGHAAHGGAWKIAYADFVTAMMAFFLLMWLLGSTTEGDKKGIADFFNSPLKIALLGGELGVARFHFGIDGQFVQLAVGRRGGNLLGRITLRAAENHLDIADRLRRRTARHRHPIRIPRERIAIGGQPRMVRVLLRMEGQDLEISAVVPGRNQPKPLDLRGDVCRTLHVPDAANLTAEHRIVRELV